MPGLDPATEVLDPPRMQGLLASTRQTWEMEAFPELTGEVEVSSCPAACCGQRVVAAQCHRLPWPGGEVGISSYV